MTLPNHQSPAGRHIGVMNTPSERSGDPRYTGKRNTVLDITPAEMYVVQATDDQGRLEEPYVVLVVSGRVMLPPNYKEWTQQLRPVPDSHWLHKEFFQHHAQKKNDKPVAKDVDVLEEPEAKK